MARSKQSASVFSTHRPVLDFLTFALALLGILVVVHLWIQSGRGFDRGCFGFDAPAAVDPTFNCEAVINSDSGKLFGVSNVIWGLGFYVIIAALSFFVLLRSGPALKQLKSGRALMLVGGLLYSGYLSYVQYFQLGEFCKLCLISASIVALLFIVMLVEYFNKPKGRLPEDVSILRKVPFFGALAGVAVLLAIADFAYFNSLETGTAPIAASAAAVAGPAGGSTTVVPVGVCGFDTDKKRIDGYMDLVSFSDPSKGNPDSPVTVIEFFDPLCPHCKSMEPVMDKIIDEYGDRARFVYRPFLVFPQSMQMIEALHAAAQQGLFFEMMDAQFERQTNRALTMAELEEVATEIGANWELMKHRLDNQMFRSVVLRHRNSSAESGVGVVPTIMINGRIIKSESKTISCIKELIDRSMPESSE